MLDQSRRKLMALLGGAAATWPMRARAQQRPHTIGFLGPASASVMGAWTAAFAQRLARAWLDRGTHHRDRVPLGGRTRRPSVRACGRAVRLNASRYRDHRYRGPAIEAGDLGLSPLSSRLQRPGGWRTGHQPVAAWRQRHRLLAARADLGGKARRNLARGGARPAAPGHSLQCRQCGDRIGDGTGSGRRPNPRLEVVNAKSDRAEDITPAIEGLKDRADAIYIQTTVDEHQSGAHQHAGAGRHGFPRLGDPRVCGSGCSDVLWPKLPGPGSAGPPITWTRTCGAKPADLRSSNRPSLT